MFKSIYINLKSQGWINSSPEIEVLKGLYEKPTTFKEAIKKGLRRGKFKK
jgi:hypothetical protein